MLKNQSYKKFQYYKIQTQYYKNHYIVILLNNDIIEKHKCETKNIKNKVEKSIINDI